MLLSTFFAPTNAVDWMEEDREGIDKTIRPLGDRIDDTAQKHCESSMVFLFICIFIFSNHILKLSNYSTVTYSTGEFLTCDTYNLKFMIMCIQLENNV
jgi:hypothetical protein